MSFVVFPFSFVGGGVEPPPVPPTNVGIFYGGNGTNIVTVITQSLTLASAQTNVGSGRSELSGAGIDNIGFFYGGNVPATAYTSTRVDSLGTQVGSETTTPYTGQYGGGANAGSSIAIFKQQTTAIRFNSSGTLLGASGGYGQDSVLMAGAGIAGIAMFTWGFLSKDNIYDICRINSSGTSLGNTSTTPNSSEHGAANASGTVILYGGNFTSNQLVRINSSGTQVGSTTTAGPGRANLAGANCSSLGLFFGGGGNNTAFTFNSSGTQVGGNVAIGSGRFYLAGAGVP